MTAKYQATANRPRFAAQSSPDDWLESHRTIPTASSLQYRRERHNGTGERVGLSRCTARKRLLSLRRREQSAVDGANGSRTLRLNCGWSRCRGRGCSQPQPAKSFREELAAADVINVAIR